MVIIYTCLSMSRSSSSERSSASSITVFAHHKFVDWSNQKQSIISVFSLGIFEIFYSDKSSPTNSWLRITAVSEFEYTRWRLIEASVKWMIINTCRGTYTHAHTCTRDISCAGSIRMYIYAPRWARIRFLSRERKAVARKKNSFGFVCG